MYLLPVWFPFIAGKAGHSAVDELGTGGGRQDRVQLQQVVAKQLRQLVAQTAYMNVTRNKPLYT